MKKYKQHIRAANMLLKALYTFKYERLWQIRKNLEDFRCKYSDLTKDSRIFQRAVDNYWYSSAEKICSRISRNLNDFSYQLEHFKNIINTDDIKLPKPGHILAELLQIEQEFGEIKIDIKARTISVVTGSIILDEIRFGPFEIKLFIDDIKKTINESPYKVIALEPNPASSDNNVTHPHVSHENLCEGDGYITIRKAIQQGRFNDFFTIIVQILQTYNPDSPYVPLENWEGISCYDCGYSVAGDDCYFCENCERDFCSNCSTYCRICETIICLGCSFECPDCGQPVCRHCTDICSECGKTLCKDCIDEEGLCKKCQEQRKEQEDEKNKQETEESQTGPAIQPDSLGQVAIHAGYDS